MKRKQAINPLNHQAKAKVETSKFKAENGETTNLDKEAAALKTSAQGAETEVATEAETDFLDADFAAQAIDADAAETLTKEQEEAQQEQEQLLALQTENSSLKAELATLKSELQNLQAQDLSLRAEYDNFRRRTQQEKERIYGDALQTLSKDFLPLLDNLVRAQATSDEQAKRSEEISDLKQAQAVLQSLLKGNLLILQQAQAIFNKLGITEIVALGAEFNPELHQAVLHVEDPAYGNNEVIEVFETGYMYGDRVLRPAMVKVAN